MTPPRKRWGVLVLLFAGFFSVNSSAHTLPVSYLTIVQDKNYLHAELTLNPFELNFISEFDANKNRLLDPSELQASDKLLSERILQHIKIKLDNELLSAETVGISGEPAGHHFTLRAHFPVTNAQAALSIESDLAGITSASHLTEVTFLKGEERQLARLDSQKQLATFGSEIKQVETTTPVKLIRNDSSTPGFLIILPLTILPTVLGLFLLLKFTKNLRHASTPQS
jgi:hypothetical protein